uniref:Phosphotransferase n=1 Tax=Neolamprologus brichardi TaxID=32507 RepID=A0A3Q4HSD5_NEOBR
SNTRVEKYLQPFQLSPETLQEVSARLRKDLLRGLGKHSHHKAPVKMLPTFVRATPDGTEKGDFLALDLGGTNFRVLHVRVEEEAQKVLKMDSQICAIPQEMMLGTGEQLFDHIATCLGDFLESHNLKCQTLPLGFTFSFPCEQLEIDKSILIRWTKGFNCSGVEGKDVVQLLKEAIQRTGVGPKTLAEITLMCFSSGLQSRSSSCSVLVFYPSAQCFFIHTRSATLHTLIAVSVDANSLMMFEHQSNCSSYSSHECRGKATKKLSLSKKPWT